MRQFILLLLCSSIAVVTGCSDHDRDSAVDATGSTPAEDKTFRLSGTVTNQFGVPVEGVNVVVGTTGSYIDSAVTTRAGFFIIHDVPEGSVTITARSSEIAAYDKLRFLPVEESLTVDQDLLLTLGVREYTLLFEDHGQGASQWTLHGGVTCDGSAYIFVDSQLQKDYMAFSRALDVPSQLDSLYLVVSGWATPADSAIITGTFYEAGAPLGLTWAVFHLEPDTRIFAIHNIAGIIGHQVTLELEKTAEYNPQPHPEVTAMINEIVIFGY